MGRYDNRLIFNNNTDFYRQMLAERGKKNINQFSTPTFKYPSPEQIANLQLVGHVWKIGDRFYKLAHEYYGGDSTLWYIIAWFNKKPTEHHVQMGEVIYVPMPLDRVLEFFGL